MTFFDYLNAKAERRNALRLAKVDKPSLLDRLIDKVLPIEFRGWLALALFIQSSSLFGLVALFPELQESQGFMTLASAVIVTGWVGGAAAFAYAAGKNAAESSEQVNAALRVAEAAQPQPAKPDVVLDPGETAQARD